MFEKASRLRLRFNYRGLATTEDLWVIPLQALDKMYQELSVGLKESQGIESLLGEGSPMDNATKLAMDIIKHVVMTRLAERDAAHNLKAKAEQKQKILEIISEKQDSSLRGKSIEELSDLVRNL